MEDNSNKSTNIIRSKQAVGIKPYERKTSVVKNQILQAKVEAKKIVEEAESYANQVKTAADKDATNVLEQAYEKGLEDALFEMQQNLIESKKIREKIVRETEKDILKLAVKLSEKIVGREIKDSKKTIVDIITNALQNARQQERITIRVNPNDLQNVQKNSKQFESFVNTKYLDIIADPRVEAGGCLIESEVGTVDARLETQFRVLERALLAQADGEFVREDL